MTSPPEALNGVHWQVICCLVSAEIKQRDRMTSRRSPMLGVISDARAEICSSENRTSLRGQLSLRKGLLRMTHKPLSLIINVAGWVPRKLISGRQKAFTFLAFQEKKGSLGLMLTPLV